MRERQIIILVALILNFNGEMFAQQKVVEKNVAPYIQSTFYAALPAPVSSHNTNKVYLAQNPFNSSVAFGKPNKTTSSFPLRPMRMLNKDFESSLPFFCRKEYQFEKATAIPLKFRLGSIEYTDYLERKPNAIAPFR